MFRIQALLFCLFLLALRGNSQVAPESGKPLKVYTKDGDGLFALPSVNGFVMGMAKVNNDAMPDLFMYSDRYNPGTFCYEFLRYSREGVPVFGEKKRVTLPFEENQSKSVILEVDKGAIFGFWAAGSSLRYGELDKKALAFSEIGTTQVKGLPGGIGHFGVLQLSENQFLYLFSVADTIRQTKYPLTPTDPMHRHDYESYGQEGFWQQQLPKMGIYGAFVNDLKQLEIHAKPLSTLTQAYYGLENYTLYTVNGEQYVIVGSTLANIHAYKINSAGQTLTENGYLVDEGGQTLRNPVIHGYLTYFKAPDKEGLIVSGEGGIYFYPNTGRKSKAEKLIFQNPRHLRQQNPDLYGSSLVVPNLVDWDGDGDLDIVSGTSTGHIHFIKNNGTDALPLFTTPETIKAGGYEIYIQPGYNQDIQGPVETRWGYASPAVYDWDGDGLPDILTGDSRGKFNIYLNRGTKQKPRLEPEHPLYLDGLDVHGTWRVRPGVGSMNGKNAYIILDTDDEFHLYWQLDNYNLTDGGKLMIGDSIPIRANFKKGGETGRSKITIVDWDQDGVKDLLVGTPRYSTIPEPKKGIPYRLKNNGAAVVFLRNAGTEAKPVYEYPVALRFKGQRINLGQHEIGVATGYLGPGKSLNLIVGDETGRFYFYKRSDLEWTPVQEEFR